MTVFYHNTTENVGLLVADIKGLPPVVANAWLECEGQEVNNPTNPLNILYYGRTGQIKQANSRFAAYADAGHGLADAAWLINTSSYYASVRAALNVGHPIDIAHAIELSPWSAGHYGATSTTLGCIGKAVAAAVGHPPTPAPKPTWINYQVKSGDTLSSIAQHYLGNANLWRTIWTVNRQIIGSNPNLIHPGQVLRIPSRQ